MKSSGLEPTLFEQRRTKINKRLNAELAIASKPYKVITKRRKPYARYGIEMPKEKIIFLDSFGR